MCTLRSRLVNDGLKIIKSHFEKKKIKIIWSLITFSVFQIVSNFYEAI